MSPLVLLNSLECARELGIAFDKILVLFSGKLDNLGKLVQARNISRFFEVQGIFHFRVRPSFNLPGRPFVFRIVKRSLKCSEESLNEATFRLFLRKHFPSDSPDYLIGGGSHLKIAKAYAPGAQVYVVDAGVSAVKGRLANQLSRGVMAFSLYSSETLGVLEEQLLQNHNRLLVDRTLRVPVCQQEALFVSTNSGGRFTNNEQYNALLTEAKQRHNGTLVYYRRGNESRSVARTLCRRHDLQLVDVDWPVEMYPFAQLGCIPAKIFSPGSSALWFFRKIQASRDIELINLIWPEYKARHAFNTLEHQEQNAKGNGFVQIIENGVEGW